MGLTTVQRYCAACDSNPGMVNLYQHTKSEENISIDNRHMAKNPNYKMAAAAMLNFGESAIWGYSNPYMVNLYQQTKFEANIFINDRDMTKNRKSNMAAAAILNFGKSAFWATVTQIWSISISILNLKQMSSLTIKIWPNIENLRQRPPLS